MRESFVGVDVAKAELVVACRPAGPAWTASNDAEGASPRFESDRPTSGCREPRICRRMFTTSRDNDPPAPNLPRD